MRVSVNVFRPESAARERKEREAGDLGIYALSGGGGLIDINPFAKFACFAGNRSEEAGGFTGGNEGNRGEATAQDLQEVAEDAEEETDDWPRENTKTSRSRS